MNRKIRIFLCLSFLPGFLLGGCGSFTGKSDASLPAERAPGSRPQTGFLWVFAMNGGTESAVSDIHYLSQGHFRQTQGPFECSVQIEAEELNLEQKSVQQKAHVDCGEKQVNTVCETNKHEEPFEIRIEKDGKYLKALLGCDNGQNEVPPRIVFPGTTIMSSTVLEPRTDESTIRSTTVFPYKTHQNYAWIMFVSSDHKVLHVRTELTYEKPLSEWPGFPKSLKVSNDGRSGAYEKVVNSENGNFILGDQYHVAKTDPGGNLRIRVYIEDHLADEYWLRFL